ncbi:MAG: hypothetical protein ABI451_10245 [Dokdonella sp.]
MLPVIFLLRWTQHRTSSNINAMNSLFDSLGPAARSPEIIAALGVLSGDGDTQRGAVFTKPDVVDAIPSIPRLSW